MEKAVELKEKSIKLNTRKKRKDKTHSKEKFTEKGNRYVLNIRRKDSTLFVHTEHRFLCGFFL
jgi:hypothetical protein